MPVQRKRRVKLCPLCADGVREVDYKDVNRLRRFTSDRGKILPRRVTGVCAFHQRSLSRAIKRAREMALLPYVMQ
ncbi:MAG TPA: 30S ribosomal protein S18 [Coprothermobacter proteolyticus]|nr:30S ribosomal protein S18 [Coprothermobacter proteolyticus]